MSATSIQRFAILLMLFGGFFEVAAAAANSWYGIRSVAKPIMFIALGIGAFGVILSFTEGEDQ